MLTKVLDMGSGETVAEYTLPPLEALVAAWEQHHKNFNTWEYAKKLEQDEYPIKTTKYGISLGKFWVEKNPEESLVELLKEE